MSLVHARPNVHFANRGSGPYDRPGLEAGPAAWWAGVDKRVAGAARGA